MVDSVLLLVDAAEGPLPQTRYVLQKAMARRLPVVVAINKIDRSDARPDEVVDQVYELFIDLGADEHQIEFPIVYTNAKPGEATLDLDQPGTDLCPMPLTCLSNTPPPTHETDHLFSCSLTNLSANDYVGRMAIGRLWNGHSMGNGIIVREEATTRRQRRAGTRGHDGRNRDLLHCTAHRARGHRGGGPGEIVAVAGLPEVTIGDTLTDPADPRPLPGSTSTRRRCG